VAALYDRLRRDEQLGADRAAAFRAAKDRLFAEHPSSPVPADDRRAFPGLRYWPYDEAFALSAELEPDPDAAPPEVPRSGQGSAMPFTRIGSVRFAVHGQPVTLSVFWLNEYAGGIFIPFRDTTNGSETYGGGRYLWDSAKGADLGSDRNEIALDFNFAFHPSCVYDPSWSCPLSPPENWLSVPIEAGERLTPDA
jgi:uncharacterized protein (DUF1684 family)